MFYHWRITLLVFLVALSGCRSETPTEVLIDGNVVRGHKVPVEHRQFVFYRNRPPHNHGDNESSSTCFSVLGKGAKWKVLEPFETTFAIPTGTWNAVASIFGPGTMVGSVPLFDGSMDGRNTAQFGPWNDTNVLALASVWGIFRGPPGGRELLEWDVLMNSNQPFGDAASDGSVFDVQGIAAHEIGHAAGLGHPDDSCTEETMYRFASKGETKKRILNAGDIAGIHSLY